MPEGDIAKGVSTDSPEHQRLRVQRLERSLVRAQLLEPGILLDPDYQALRYALGLARLHRFVPAGGTQEVDVNVLAVARLRNWLLERLYNTLRGEGPASTAERLGTCAQVVPECRKRAGVLRATLLAQNANTFAADSLDREAGQRALVTIAGGGGGAGFVYLGAYARLHEAGLIPDYIVGNSIGSVVGLFRAYRRRLNVDYQMDFVKNMRLSDVLGTSRKRAQTCLPGLLQLHLRALHKRFVTGDLRRPLRMDEMEIPLDLIVAGVRRGSFQRLPKDVLEPRGAGAAGMLPFPVRLATRLWRLARFTSPEVTRPFVFGRDADTRALHAVDVVGFSAAVPTVLQYELRGNAGATREVYAEFMQQHGLAALVDGGVADNVPARAAWEGVSAGRIGTRNAYYLGFDCFQPQLELKHLWLWPAMQAVQMQMRRNRVYADTMIHFSKTLSPINLIPAAASLEHAFAWGWQEMDAHIGFATEMLRPVSLSDGDSALRRAS